MMPIFFSKIEPIIIYSAWISMLDIISFYSSFLPIMYCMNNIKCLEDA
jgi:hypothetical protein